MWNKLSEVLARRLRQRALHRRQEAFFARYAGRTLIAHAGLDVAWLEELLKLGGGGAHFRIDARIPPSKSPTPVEWVVHDFVLPLNLPLPLLLAVKTDTIAIRHLHRYGMVCHPADIAWILDDIRERGRVHAMLHVEKAGFRAMRGIPVEDNEVDTPYGAV